MKRLLAALLAWPLLLPVQAQAGSIDYLSNESADYIRTFSRNAATDAADAVNYNPAGTAFLRDGLHLNISSQTIFKFYSITFNGTEFEAKDPTPALPAFYAIYKWRHLAGFVAFTIPAGGGSLTYKSGIPYLIPLSVFAGSLSAPSNGRFEGSSMFLAPSFGAAYELFGRVSLSAVGRAVIARKSYKGSATYGNIVAELDSKKNAAGFGGIFGVHVRPIKGLDLGIRYETETPLEFEAETTTKNLNIAPATPLASFANGAKEKRNLPAVLGVGVSYRLPFFERLSASVSWNYYFINQADSEADVTTPSPYVRGYDDDYGNGMDLGAAVELRILPSLLASVGYNHSFSGGNAKTYSDFEYALSSNSVGGGARYTLWDRFDITAALAGTFYLEDQNDGLGRSGPEETWETFRKTALTLAVGLAYRFF